MQEINPDEVLKYGAGVFKVVERVFGKAASTALHNALEQRSAKTQASNALDLRVIELYSDRVVRMAEEMPTPELSILAKAASKRGILKQHKINDTVIRALAILPQKTIEDQNRTVSDEFLDTFESIAENQSTEHMQELFARILAGEIQRPGSFSKRSLRVAEQLDRSTAELFQRLCSMAFVRDKIIALLGGRIVINMPKEVNVAFSPDKIIPGLKGDPKDNSLGEFGLNFVSLSRLAEYGLILPGITMYTAYRICVAPYPGNAQLSVTVPIEFQGTCWTLQSTPEPSRSFENFKMTGVGFSAIGNELFQVVEKIPVPEYHKALTEFLQSEDLQMRRCSSTHGSVF